ncbi:hypothetical protein MUU46_18825 [Scandinavium sp. TWS1a]|uniref:hypothetical protein n=1 Tax=Scandinavium tedordense TaxID=2926521 RepID=UPI0021655161|nr:hypothetical protein [Scandinavium tedordense]MCS2172344.1 hypothetical protein [Scandinavium tedordense]
MIVLSDNDVILKLAQSGLLRYLPDILGEDPSGIFVSPTARFQLLPRNTEKAIKKCGNPVIYENVGRFLDSVQVIDEIKDDALLMQLGEIPHIDIGEQQLLASCVEQPGALFMTGDRRCLQAVMDNQTIVTRVHARLINSVITYESALLLSVRVLGFDTLYQQLQTNPNPDAMLKMAMRSACSEDVCGCFFSFTRPVYDYLAYKEHLPDRSWQL